ncbi:hypothetical protein KIPB_009589, partial [Kipferlia bialata]
VYGLGANALDSTAVTSIFTAKRRPSCDPLICHIHSIEQVSSLTSCAPAQYALMEYLARDLWPGPITFVLPRKEGVVPDAVTAGGDTVGIRCPNHPIALALLRHAQVPVAAPSANLFGHISPTSASHVAEDLGDCVEGGLLILDGGDCRVGIESTVVSVLYKEESLSLHVWRRGGVSVERLQALLAAGGDLYRDVPVTAAVRSVSGTGTDVTSLAEARADEEKAETEGEGEGEEKWESDTLAAPGQLLTHYAPRCEAVLFSASVPPIPGASVRPLSTAELATAAVLDFAGTVQSQYSAAPLSESCLFYRDLSPGGLPSEASSRIFAALREAEHVAGTKLVIICSPLQEGLEREGERPSGESGSVSAKAVLD